MAIVSASAAFTLEDLVFSGAAFSVSNIVAVTDANGQVLLTALGLAEGTDNVTAVSEGVSSNTAVITVAEGRTATVAATLPKVTGAASAKLAIQGSLAKSLPKVTAAATAKLAIQATLAKSLPTVSAAASAKLAIQATAAPTLPKVTMAASGSVTGGRTATVAATLPTISGAASAKLAIQGAVAVTLPRVAAASSAKLAIQATAAATLPKVTLAASGTLAAGKSGTVTATLPRVTLAASGTVAQPPRTATMAATLPTVTALLDARTLTALGGSTTARRGGLLHEQKLLAKAEREAEAAQAARERAANVAPLGLGGAESHVRSVDEVLAQITRPAAYSPEQEAEEEAYLVAWVQENWWKD